MNQSPFLIVLLLDFELLNVDFLRNHITDSQNYR